MLPAIDGGPNAPLVPWPLRVSTTRQGAIATNRSPVETGGGEVVPFAACDSVKLCPAIVTGPDRSTPEFAAIERLAVPLPVPEDPEATVTHEGMLVAAHVQPEPVVMLTVTVEDPAPRDSVEGDTEYAQAN